MPRGRKVKVAPPISNFYPDQVKMNFLLKLFLSPELFNVKVKCGKTLFFLNMNADVYERMIFGLRGKGVSVGEIFLMLFKET